jgi:hypothetical protein
MSQKSKGNSSKDIFDERRKIEGIVERYAPGLIGHGEHQCSVLLIDNNEIYTFPRVREVYSPEIGRPSSSLSQLVELMAAGDHISFEIREHRVLPETLRNWTLEHRLIGQEIDITPAKPTINILN